MIPFDFIRRFSFFTGEARPGPPPPVNGARSMPPGAPHWAVPSVTNLEAVHPRCRTAVVLDVNNLALSARDHGCGFDPARLHGLLRLRCGGVLASAAVGGHEPELSRHRDVLVRAGFVVVAHEAQLVAGRFKADLDSVVGGMLAKHVIRDRVGQVVLGSGDGDFVPLLSWLRDLRSQPLRVVVLAVPGSIGRALELEADAVVRVGRDVLRRPSAMGAAF
jgi:hypothetical protein